MEKQDYYDECYHYLRKHARIVVRSFSAVENYFIIHTYVSSDHTDYNTYIPVLEKHKEVFERYPEEATADSGYCSEKNLHYECVYIERGPWSFAPKIQKNEN